MDYNEIISVTCSKNFIQQNNICTSYFYSGDTYKVCMYNEDIYFVIFEGYIQEITSSQYHYNFDI